MNSEVERLARRFEQFAEEARGLSSPLYEHVSRQIAQDEPLLRIAGRVRRPPEPNMLFAAVHYLLMDMPWHPLADFYGSLRESPRQASEAYADFREFVFSNQSSLIPILTTRITQTNEVRRCSYLLPAFSEIYQSAERRPLALIDVGCSAGLHLLWDRYAYDYGSVKVGRSDAPVVVRCKLRGAIRPPIPATFPECAYRLGIDLNPVDLNDPVERRWFEALVWPDHRDRWVLAASAIEEWLSAPPPMVKGDAVSVLPYQLREVPTETTLIVYHCHAMCQASAKDVEAFGEILMAFSAVRPVYWLVCEGAEVELRTLRDGAITQKHLAHKDGHGRWLEWL
ncbi:MAG: DUF2332 domain-containing protein [Anaerolineales bacterium]